MNHGKIYGIIGANGVGKSTLLRIINGIYDQDEGSVTLDNQIIKDNETIKQDICFVSDDSYYFRGYTAKSMAKFYQAMYNKFDMKKYNELAKILDLNVDKKLSEFSKGMKRQSSLICCLATNAKYMFFDETFDGLDPLNRKKIKSFIRDYVNEGNTIIMTSHNMKELEDICDIMEIIEDGSMVQADMLKEKMNEIIKVQVAFEKEFDQSLFYGLDILDYSQSGRVATIVFKGDRNFIKLVISELNPLLVDELELTLEEMFIYEKEGEKNGK